jgi:hypothetical protein
MSTTRSSTESPCPNCGSIDARRWRIYDTLEVCDECALETMLGVERALRNAARPKREPSSPLHPRRRIARTVSTLTTSALHQRRPGAGRKRVPVASYCLTCSHIYYDQTWSKARSSCGRCGGICAHYDDDSLRLMERHTTAITPPWSFSNTRKRGISVKKDIWGAGMGEEKSFAWVERDL